MKPYILITLFVALHLGAEEIPMVDQRHAFPSGLVATEVYRSGDLVLVSTCISDEWAAQISTSSGAYRFTGFSKLLPLGGGGISKLFSRDYDQDGKADLMACLYNGGRSGTGANQNQVVFFILAADKVELRATGWVEDFDPKKGLEYFKRSIPVTSPEETTELIRK